MKTLKDSPLCFGTSQNIVFFNYTPVTQNYVNRVLADYPGLRDFHNKPPYLGPLVHIANFIATAVNATLISPISINQDVLCMETFKMIPTLYLEYGVNLKGMFETTHVDKRPSVVQRNSLSFNFGVCGEPQKQNQGISPLEIFQSSADPPTWLCLGIALILITTLVKIMTHSSFSTSLILNLSVLLRGGSSTSKSTKKLWLLTLWTSTCLLFDTYYSGSLTSVVMSPAKEYTLSGISQLLENNYSLVARNPWVLSSLKNLVLENPYQDEADILKQLIPTATIASAEEEFHETFVISNSKAYVALWQDCILIVNRAEAYIEKNKIEGRRCYVGEELIFPQSSFFVVKPPGRKAVAGVIETMMEAGFYTIWIKEITGIAISTRVQGRSKMINPTKLFEEKEQPKAIQMRGGKLTNVFLMWLSGLFLCLAGLGFEMWIVRKPKRKNISHLPHIFCII